MNKASGATDVRELIVENIPSMRAFARALANDRDRADDLVQETIVKALANLDRFQTGTNIRAWLFTILRNSFFSELRKQRREVADVDGKYAAQLTIRPNQVERVEFRDFRRALLKLPTEQREALILVGPAGFSYEEAAAISGCAVGTIKSRVNRGRTRLTEMVNGETPDVKRKSVA
ncbi:MAG: sigma-70 family RNA polymerase sigma factor [Rhodospirillales bacterium]